MADLDHPTTPPRTRRDRMDPPTRTPMNAADFEDGDGTVGATVTPREARQGTSETRVFNVLTISTGLAAIACIIAVVWFFYEAAYVPRPTNPTPAGVTTQQTPARPVDPALVPANGPTQPRTTPPKQ